MAALALGSTAAAGTILGRVIDPEGGGVPGVLVRAWCVRWGNAGYEHTSRVSTETVAGGRFQLEVPSKAAVTLHLYPADFVQPPPRRSAAGERVTVTLERGAPISGRVETPTGTVVPGASVTAAWKEADGTLRACRAYTDEAGAFRILVPRPAHVGAQFPPPLAVLQESPPGWIEPPRPKPAPGEAWQGPVEPGADDLCIVLADRARVLLRVRGPEGRLDERVGLRVVDLGRPLPPFSFGAHAGADIEVALVEGRYGIEVLPHGDVAMPTRVEVRAPSDPVEVICAAAATLRGRVEGEHLAGFEVSWGGPHNPHWDDPSRRYSERMGLPPSASVDPETGSFELRAIADEAGDVYVHRPNDARHAQVVAVPSDGPLVVRLRHGASIAGRVALRDRRTVGWLDVRARRGAVVQVGTLAANGGFEIRGLPPGRYDVELFQYGVGVHDVQTRVEAGTRDVVLSAPGR